MKKLITLVICCVLGLSTFAQTEQEINISGIWIMTNETPRGKKVNEITITQEGNQAIAKSKKNEFTITIEGNKVKWTQKVSTPMGKMTTDNKGTVEGETMKGTMIMAKGPMSGKEMKWSAIKKVKKE